MGIQSVALHLHASRGSNDLRDKVYTCPSLYTLYSIRCEVRRYINPLSVFFFFFFLTKSAYFFLLLISNHIVLKSNYSWLTKYLHHILSQILAFQPCCDWFYRQLV